MHTPLARVLSAICLALSLVLVSGCSSGNSTPAPTEAPSNLSYPTNPATYTVGMTISSNRPTVTGRATSWSIAPALPAGLTLHDKSGTIAGTPTAASAQTDYTVEAANNVGSTSVTVTITVEASLAAPSNLSYATNPAVYTEDVAITANQPTVTGTVTGWSVTPALPAGLSLDAGSGVISGTPSAATSMATYTVEASNASGSTDVDLVITVNPPVQASDGDVLVHGDIQADSVWELWSYRSSTTGWTNVSGTTPTGIRTQEVKVSPDRTKAAYLSETAIPGTAQLYVGEVGSSSPTLVNGTLANGEISIFEWAPDSSRLFYIADLEPIGDVDLWTVLPDGTGNTKVNGDGTNFARVAAAQWSPDSSKIAFVADLGSDNTQHAFVAAADGTGQVQVSGTLKANYDVMQVEWSPDGEWVAVKVRNAAWDEVELFAAKADGSEFNMLHPNPGVGKTVGDFAWAPDSSYCAFLQGEDGMLGRIEELFNTRPSGAASIVRVSHQAGSGQEIRLFRWAPDSSRIAYIADRDQDRDYELFSTLKGSIVAPVQIGGDLSASDGSVVGNFKWTPDSSQVIYLADQRTNNRHELYSTAPDSMSNTVLLSTATPVGGGDVEAFEIAADGSRVAFSSDQRVQTQYELWTQTLGGSPGAPIVVSANATYQTEVDEFEWSADSSKIYYIGDTVTYRVDDLFIVDPAAANSAVEVNPHQHPDGDLRGVWPLH